MTRQAFDEFSEWVAKTYGDRADEIDTTAYYDETLSISENKTEFLERWPPEGRWKKMTTPDQEQIFVFEQREQEDKTKSATDAPLAQMLAGVKVVCILGDTGSGKSCLSHRVADEKAKDGRDIYVFKHQRPDLLPKNYKVLHQWGMIEHLEHCVLLLAEPQLVIPRHDHHANDGLLALFSLCRQRDVVVIIDTSDTRYVTRGIESYVSAWMIKDIEPSMVKQGSMVKKIIKDNVLLDIDGFRVAVNQFVYHCRAHPEFEGRHSFTKPAYWSETLSTQFSQRNPQTKPHEMKQ